MTTPVGEGAQSGAEGTQSGAGTTTGTIDGGTDSGTEGAQSGTTQAQPTESDTLKAQLDQQRQRTQAADKRAADIEAQLKQLRDKDLPEAEKLKRDFEAAQTQVTQLQETNRNLALQVAFLSDNTFTWHNPERALKLVDLTQVEINADGTVSGLKEALKALATSDAYLLKQEATQEVKPPAGTAPANNGGTGQPGGVGKKQMAARWPAMNTRVKRS